VGLAAVTQQPNPGPTDQATTGADIAFGILLACCMYKWGDETAAGAGTIQKVQVLEELLHYAR
jgi:hypothetical protein